MKLKLILSLVAVLLLIPLGASFAAEFYPMMAYGSLMEKGQEGRSGTWLGQEASLYRDAGTGLNVVERLGYFSVSSGEDIQALSASIMAKKTLGVWNSVGWYAAIGGNYQHEIEDGPDNGVAAIKFETGVDLYRRLGISIGIDLVPKDEKPDQWFLYGLIDLAPKL